jgi:uncharacterized protein (TIGR02145 family)
MKKLYNLVAFASLTVWMITFSGCKKEVEMPSVTTRGISQITAVTAVTGGEITSGGNAMVTARGVCWSTSPNPTIADSLTIEGTGSGSFTSTISGLEQNTKYYVRAYATNSAGTGYGPEISFTTGHIMVPNLDTRQITQISFASALTGGIFQDYDDIHVTEAGICWSTSANPTTSDNIIPDIYLEDPASDFIIPIYGLKPSTQYFVRAYAVTSSGTNYGDELSFTTSAVKDILFNPDLVYGSVADIDGNLYKTIVIGRQTWMAENLRTTSYNDGTPIPEVTDNNAWGNLNNGGYCWYNGDAASFKTVFGGLYNWYSVVDNRKICPAGWHVPTDAEWTRLLTYVGGESISGSRLKEKGTTHWLASLSDNETGFTALPGGFRDKIPIANGIPFQGMGSQGAWWSTTEYDTQGAIFSTTFIDDYVDRFYLDLGSPLDKNSGLSVRCLMDN